MSTKMPELIIFAKALLLGFILSEIFRITYLGGSGLYSQVGLLNPLLQLLILGAVMALLIWYAVSRGIIGDAKRLIRSQRVDLLLTVGLGIWTNQIISPLMHKFHGQIEKANPLWALLLASFILIMILSTLFRTMIARRKANPNQMYFLTDVEIQNNEEDMLANKEHAIQFAQTVLVSGSNSGLVYGIDAPWGTGKTSFINLASNYWKKEAENEVIYFRFEPLRYASDPDLAERFIRDLSAEIQHQAYIPEFPPAITRYSRLLKGKADFSFLGIKFTLDPANETIDESLASIDDALKRLGRRLIVVIDDLDRLDIKAINNVLFTVQRTFKLTQAAYILCYDTEIIVGTKDGGDRARQFLEKFINIKISLFVESTLLIRFLKTDWNKNEEKYQSIPSDTMLKLSSILSELANILEGEHASQYMPLIGDMRKLKRFVNAILMMQIEKTNLAHTDFNSRDLINLMLLHLHYPGIFRRIYLEETEGRSGIFSIKRNYDSGNWEYSNAEGYEDYVESLNSSDKFLLNQLFSLAILELGSFGDPGEALQASRACFNIAPYRNLEKYLKLIVRFATPEPRNTFKLYQDAVAKVVGGTSVKSVLSDPRFDLKHGEHAHDQFWRILISQSYDFKEVPAADSINILVEFLPKYSSVDYDDRGLRIRSIYNLIRLLDRAGWGRTSGKRRPNSSDNIIEIAHLIFGEKNYSGHSLIERLIAEDRGVLGWHDLILFRLQCSADRQGQIYNLHGALILHQDMNAPTSGMVAKLALTGMRRLSQRVFALFKTRYIDTKRNLFDDFDAVTDVELLGDASDFCFAEAKINGSEERLRNLIEATRSNKKSFMVYQLANSQTATGAGVGTGYYDVSGTNDDHGIADFINDYIFGICFNPEPNEKNFEHFLNYCLTNLTSSFWSGGDEEGYHPTKQSLIGGLNPVKFAAYWAKHRDAIKARNYPSLDRKVFTNSYIADYATDLPKVFEVLDQP